MSETKPDCYISGISKIMWSFEDWFRNNNTSWMSKIMWSFEDWFRDNNISGMSKIMWLFEDWFRNNNISGMSKIMWSFEDWFHDYKFRLMLLMWEIFKKFCKWLIFGQRAECSWIVNVFSIVSTFGMILLTTTDRKL